MKLKKLLFTVLCLSLAFLMICGSALTANAVTQSEIDELKKKKASSQEILDAVSARVNELMVVITENNNRINTINANIAANNAEIAQRQADIERDKAQFRKRLRSIYMSNSESKVKVLLGAESFSQYLQLSQLTASVSSFDKRLIENLVEEIRILDEKNKENEKLLAEQMNVKADLDAKYAELAKQQAEAQQLFDSASQDVAAAEEKYQQEQEEMRRRAAAAASGGGSSGGASAPTFSGSANFKWPHASDWVIAGFASNDSVHRGTHNGVDIAASGIMGTPIYAIGDGYVTYVANSCPHNFGKNYSCGCGGGYGRYAQIDHGYVEGDHYVAVYAHATNIIVSPGQYVEKGQVIGYVGTTGWSTGPHLHFGLMRNGGWINPLGIAYS